VHFLTKNGKYLAKKWVNIETRKSVGQREEGVLVAIMLGGFCVIRPKEPFHIRGIPHIIVARSKRLEGVVRLRGT